MNENVNHYIQERTTEKSYEWKRNVEHMDGKKCVCLHYQF